jgi:hypothetical protein
MHAQEVESLHTHSLEMSYGVPLCNDARAQFGALDIPLILCPCRAGPDLYQGRPYMLQANRLDKVD